jgi:hypothetical protein
MNYIDGDIEQLCKIISLIDIKKLKALPRPEVGITPRPKTPWTFQKSFFVKNPPFHEDIWEKCFDFDWSCSKLEKWL